MKELKKCIIGGFFRGGLEVNGSNQDVVENLSARVKGSERLICLLDLLR